MDDGATTGVVPLRERVEVTMGRQRSPRHATGDHVIPYLRAANVKDGRLVLDDVLLMNFIPAEQEKFKLLPGDVLVTEGCGSRDQIGASARWNGEIGGVVAFQNTLLRLRAISGSSDPEFVYQWARWAFESGAFAKTATGTSIFHIGSTRAAEMPFPDLAVAEQRRIADLLASFDRHVAALEDERRRLADLADAIRFELGLLNTEACQLGGVTLPAGIQIGPFGSQLHASDYVESGVPVVMPKDMREGRIDTSSIAQVSEEDAARLSRHRLEPGDILLPRRGDLTKRALVRDDEAGWLCGTGSIRIRVPLEISRLVFEAINRADTSDWLLANAVGTTMPNLNTEIVARVPLLLPEMTEALPYVAALDRLEELHVAMQRRLERGIAARRAVRNKLLSCSHAIPASYDRLVDESQTLAELTLA